MASPRPSAASGNILDAQSLHSFLVSCPDDMVAACRAVEAFLLHQPPEAALGFFRLCFPVLLQRVFGFQDSASVSAWIVRAADEGALRSLLHPTGPLFASLLAVDRENAVQFVFPNERLPPRVRRLLLLDRGTSLLSQTSELFKNHIKVDGALHLQLDLFEYYIFWFAYYAASFNDQGSLKGFPAIKRSQSSRKRSLGRWVSGLHHPFHHHGSSSTASRYGLYLQLLHLYLVHFVQPHQFTGVVHNPGTTDISRGGFLLLTLMEFWLMQDDPWPLQASQLGAIRIVYTPPSAELCDAVRLVVDYGIGLLKASIERQCMSYEAAALVASSRVSGFRSFPGAPALSSPLRMGIDIDFALDLRLLQRPLYRFISRAFLYWPAGISVMQARYLVDVWLDYMQPWNIDFEGKPGTSTEFKHSEYRASARGYSAMWQGYVTKNYPFYTTLVVRFLEFALKSVRLNLEVVLEMTAKILGVLAGSKDLLEFLKKIDLAFYTVSGRLDHGHGSFGEMDWEESSPTSNNKVHDIFAPQGPHERAQPRLFGTGESGAFQAFQMLILQSEVEMQFASLETQRTISKALEYLKDAGLKVFDSHLLSSSIALHPDIDMITPVENESRALGRHTCFDVKYRGDWMRRPIESTEVAWLARLLVKLSDSINNKLDLVRCDDSQEASTSYEGNPQMDVFPPEVRELNVTELLKTSRNPIVNLSFSDIAKEMRAFLLRCWIVLCVQLRRQGLRVNLRFMARKPAVVFLLLLLFWMLKRF